MVKHLKDMHGVEVNPRDSMLFDKSLGERNPPSNIPAIEIRVTEYHNALKRAEDIRQQRKEEMKSRHIELRGKATAAPLSGSTMPGDAPWLFPGELVRKPNGTSGQSSTEAFCVTAPFSPPDSNLRPRSTSLRRVTSDNRQRALISF